MADSKIIDIRHPHWRSRSLTWKKWRSVMCGGDDFISEYTKKFSKRENVDDFNSRKEVTPAPCFAKSALNDVKNSIFQRTADITRRGGSETYQRTCQGQDNGVDLHGASMNTYIGREVLPELLSMARVGVYVDMPPIQGPTLLDQQGKRPYLYTYKTEEILSWTYRRDRCDEFQSLLLCDYVDDCDCNTGLPNDIWCRYRHVWIDELGKVNVQFYDDDCAYIDIEGNVQAFPEYYTLDIPFIPFVILEINDSLLSDVANHQIALLNLESSDMSYALKSNTPFYVEQQDANNYNDYLRPGDGGDGTAAAAGEAKSKEIIVGAVQGRFYGKDLEQPNFINPSPEPLMASMAKQKQLKEDIRVLINLALSNIQPKMASAESKSFDERGLEAGLSYIGLELEHAERKIAYYWAMYESNKSEITIQYPKKYSLQTDSDRREDVKQLEELRDSIPSEKFQKSISKEMVQILLGDKLSVQEIDAINKEIDKADCYFASPDDIFLAIENGVMSLEIAAKLMGLPKESVEQAAKDHAERAARVAAAQATPDPAARGVPSLSADPTGGGSAEKKTSTDTTTDPTVTSKQRGEGR